MQKSREEMMSLFEEIIGQDPFAPESEKQEWLTSLEAMSDGDLAKHYHLHHRIAGHQAKMFIVPGESVLQKKERLFKGAQDRRAGVSNDPAADEGGASVPWSERKEAARRSLPEGSQSVVTLSGKIKHHECTASKL